MNAETKVIKHKLSVLELAEALGIGSAACGQRGVSRTQFFDYKRRFQTNGMEGLRELPPIAKHHPNTTPPETLEKIKALAMTHPSKSPSYLESLLKADCVQVSFVTIQKILEREYHGSCYDRLFFLANEKHQAEQPIEWVAVQISFIENQNPQFKERYVENDKRGELLNQDTFLVGSFKAVGRVYMHVVVDTWCSYAFGFMYVSKQAEAAVAVLYNDVLTFCQKNILTDNGREFFSVKMRENVYSTNRCRPTSINRFSFTMNNDLIWVTDIMGKAHGANS